MAPNPIGTITTKFTLDKTTYQGSEPVTGIATVAFRPTPGGSSTAGSGIFGHLKLRVVLQGRCFINVAENRTSHACIFYNEKRILFSKHEDLIDGPFRAAAQEESRFPFQITFPSLTDAYKGSRDLLPPSFDTQFSAVAKRQIGRHHAAALIEYSVKVDAEMPAINVNISNDSPPKRVIWQPPSEDVVSGTSGFTQTLQLQSYALLPEQERPGFLGKTIARINSAAKPTYRFSVTCAGYPDVVAAGQEIRLELRVKNESDVSALNNIPAISLADCKVDLIARTQMYSTNQRGGDSAVIEGLETEAVLPLLTATPSGPFGKESDFSKKLVFAAVPMETTSSFLIKKVGRSYRLRLSIRFLVAEQKVELERSVNVRVFPPVRRREGIAVASSSRVAAAPVARPRVGEEDLPNYYEIGQSAPPFQQHL